MLETIVGALLPAVVTILLGYLAAWHHDFGAKDAPVLNRIVIGYALPLSIFVGTISTTRDQLLQNLPFLIVLGVAMVGMYVVVFALCRFAFRNSLGLSAVRALAASAPNGPFIGSVVLGHLYGPQSTIPVAISGVLLYLTVAPATVILLSLHTRTAAPSDAAATSATTSPVAPPPATVPRKIVEAFEHPIVWIPILGFVLVMSGVHVPKLIASSLAELGHAATGVALFAAGVILAGYKLTVDRAVLSLTFTKNIVQPALVLAALVLLNYGEPLRGEAVVMASLPTVVLVVMLAVQYGVAESEAASTLFISTLASLVTTAVFIVLTSK